jgi:16S rRNA (guanine527-N7)-methyltransferase
MPSDVIFHYFGNLSTKQQDQFKQIGPIYTAWNEKLNLISRKDIDHIYLKHVLHALSIAKVVTFKPGTHVLDVGTGGGFPGIPLAIMFPQTQFHLIDSIGKKIYAVQHIAEELGLANVVIHQIRVENIKKQYDFILGRAVTSLVTFYGWVKNNISSHDRHSIPNGILYLKGKEPLQMPTQYRAYLIHDFFDDPFFETKQLVHLVRNAQQLSNSTDLRN